MTLRARSLYMVFGIWLAFLVFGITYSLGQATNTGTVVGVVTDQSGAVIPGATVTLKDLSTNAIRTTTTNPEGHYVLMNVPPSTYSIEAVKAGFSNVIVQKQTVSVGSQANANFKLSVGSSRETVMVTGTTGADLQTLNSTIGSTVSPEAINALPSLNHDVGTFTELQPGVSPDGSVAGTAVDQSTFMLDGGNNSNDMDGSMSVYTPSFAGDPTGGVSNQNPNLAPGPTGVMPTPQDSVEEFKVNVTNQTADFNNSAGAQVEVVTKRGTNTVHGTAYEYYLDNNFSANTWDNKQTGTPEPDYHYSRFGFSAGGPVIPTNILGGRTYLFAMFEGLRYPASETYERSVPSDNMRNGIVSFGGTTYDLKALDPRGIGIDPIVQSMWSQYEPEGNDPGCGTIAGSRCDTVNEIGFKANLSLPQTSNFLVARVDHDFGKKWHWMAAYRYFKEKRATTNQVDIGGFFSGDKIGVPTSTENRPQQPWYLVTGLTTNVTSNTTNEFHYSFLRDFWSWSDLNAPPQAEGLGGALEPLGESGTGVLSPYNLDTQDIRTRFWDGKDHFLSDNITMLKGHHLIQFGGQYQHNFNYHQRTDNGGGINFTPTYQLGDSLGAGSVDLSALQAAGYPTTSEASRVAAAVYGIVTDAQVAYTRVGNNLSLNPPLTPAFDKSTIPYYNVYGSDTWQARRSLTVTYGLGYTLEMPPTEATGKQVALVDTADEPIQTEDYLARRKAAALAGTVYNPEVGFALVGNVGKGLKYPYDPFYGEFSPRISAAWNPHFDSGGFLGHIFGADATVIRGGYGRLYGRLNGVGLVLTPLLGVGLIQAVQCTAALSSGACGPAQPTMNTAFRIGVDGNSAPLPAASATLPQPDYPGYNSIAGAAAEAEDPHFRPNDIDSFDLTIQRQITRKTLIEVGYIGRLIHHEYQPINLNAVPYMMAVGGQSFENAYAAIETAMGCVTSTAQCGVNGVPNVTPQPFFEAALAGTGYCTGFANCTAAVAKKEFSNFQNQAVWSLWSDLDGGVSKSGGGFNFAPTMMNTPIPGSPNGASGQLTSGVAMNASLGYGNYNAGFVSISTHDWHGLTMQQNFTYSKALGTGSVVQASSEITANDPFDLSKMYGVQAFNRKFVYNAFVIWEEPWFKEQTGLVGRVAGGWQLAPIFTSGSGQPIFCNTQTNSSQSFGSGDGNNYFDNEQCVFTSKYNGGHSSHYGVLGGIDPYKNSVGTAVGPVAVNMFKDPIAVFDQVRAPILGIDTKNPGLGPISGMPYWNMDLSLKKNIRILSRINVEASMIFTNVLNHNVLADPSLALGDSAAWGVETSQVNTPRKMEFGGRVSF